MLAGLSFANAGRAKFSMNDSGDIAASMIFSINKGYHITIESFGTNSKILY